ncbi:MAG: hypothetical protein JWN98_1293 [Abditibacteriota bacterium]|nr:hypothetical protein [Abditibacteriota bacterium]
MTILRLAGLNLGVCVLSSLSVAQDTVPAASTPAAAPPGASSTPVTLRLKPRVGAFHVMRLSAQQVIEVGEEEASTASSAPQTGQKMLQNVSVDFNWKPLRLLPNGDSLWRFWIVSTRFERIAPGATPIRYDSKRPPQKVHEQAEFFHLMVNTGLTFRMDARGHLAEVREADKMAEAIWQKMGLKNKSDRAMLLGLLKRELGDNAFRNVGVLLATFPAAPASLGTSWAKNDPVTSDSGLIYAGHCTLQSRQNGTATIAREATVAPDPVELKKPVSERQRLPLAGWQRGTYRVEEATGYTRSALLTQEFKARIDDSGFVAGNRGQPFRMHMTLRLETVTAK